MYERFYVIQLTTSDSVKTGVFAMKVYQHAYTNVKTAMSIKVCHHCVTVARTYSNILKKIHSSLSLSLSLSLIEICRQLYDDCFT